MKHRRILLGGLAAVLAVSVAVPVAVAGNRFAQAVVVNAAYHNAYGDLGAARNSADSVQLFSCYTTTYVGADYGSCYARDAAGATTSCYTTDPGLLAAIRSVQGDSYVYFAADASATCTTVQVTHSSQLQPKNP